MSRRNARLSPSGRDDCSRRWLLLDRLVNVLAYRILRTVQTLVDLRRARSSLRQSSPPAPRRTDSPLYGRDHRPIDTEDVGRSERSLEPEYRLQNHWSPMGPEWRTWTPQGQSEPYDWEHLGDLESEERSPDCSEHHSCRCQGNSARQPDVQKRSSDPESPGWCPMLGCQARGICQYPQNCRTLPESS
jgi:hypothetical protein